MSAMLILVFHCLLVHSCLCSVGRTDTGCKKWNLDPRNKDYVCCDECHPGNRLYKKCGPNAGDLCKPCEPGTYADGPQSQRCARCTQCVGAQIEKQACTAKSDTVCGCREGLLCGDSRCSYCISQCGKGEEPTDKRGCRPCPENTYNDQMHQMCKPWSTKCPNPEEYIVDEGDAFSDIKCSNVSSSQSHKPTPNDAAEQGSTLVAFVFISMALLSLPTIIIIVVATVLQRKKTKKKKSKKTEAKKPIIRMPTDDPRTLIAMECSFHEAQQEQGSSTESLDSKDSSEQLIV